MPRNKHIPVRDSPYSIQTVFWITSDHHIAWYKTCIAKHELKEQDNELAQRHPHRHRFGPWGHRSGFPRRDCDDA